MSISTVSFSGVTKTFRLKNGDDISVFDEFSIDFNQGTTALLGPSGCGKTTLLRLAAKLTVPTCGVVDYGKHNLKIGYMFQSSVLLPWLTVYQNVTLPFSISGSSIERSDVHSMLESVGLLEFADAYPSELSGGMAARVELARSLIVKPDLLLLDEPFGSLDAITREKMQDLLINLLQRYKLCCILVTHSIDEAVYLAQRVKVLSNIPSQIIGSIDIPYFDRNKTNFRAEEKFFNLRNELASLLVEGERDE